MPPNRICFENPAKKKSHAMRRVYTVGETVYDIIFKNNVPVEGKPGGALLNSAVTLGRLGVPVCMVGDYADDQIGRIIDQFLKDNGVDIQHVTRYDNARSRLALAFLDENNNAEYSFYKIRKQGKLHVNFPEIAKGDIVLFGSFYGIKPEIREDLRSFLLKAREKEALVVYDPNFREAHKRDLPELMPFIRENVSFADVVKGSDEDFRYIWGCQTPEQAYERLLEIGSPTLVYTANRKGVNVINRKLNKHYDVPQISPVSTVGAGDTFNAGIVYGLYRHEIAKAQVQDLDEAIWDDLVVFPICFSKDVCLSYENYVSVGLAKTISLGSVL